MALDSAVKKRHAVDQWIRELEDEQERRIEEALRLEEAERATVMSYRQSARHIAGGFAGTRLDELTPTMIQKRENALMREGRHPRTILKYHKLLSLVRKHTAFMDNLVKNPLRRRQGRLVGTLPRERGDDAQRLRRRRPRVEAKGQRPCPAGRAGSDHRRNNPRARCRQIGPRAKRGPRAARPLTSGSIKPTSPRAVPSWWAQDNPGMGHRGRWYYVFGGKPAEESGSCPPTGSRSGHPRPDRR